MKKLIALILALLLAISLVACTKQNQNDDQENADPTVYEDEGWSIVV